MPIVTRKRLPITIGADPEFFVKKNGQPYPIVGLLGGTKQSPKQFHIGHVQEDNVMAEFNIPPCSSEDEFAQAVIGMRDRMTEHLGTMGLVPEFCSLMEFPMEALSSPQAQNIGCEPDFNAYTYQKNPTQDYGTMGPFRTASFHVHIGVPQELLDGMPAFRVTLARYCDMTMMLPLMLIGADNHDRRQFYGQPGSFRPKPYGLEYRGLGGEVLRNEYFIRLAYRGARAATQAVIGGRSVSKGTQDVVQHLLEQGRADEAYPYCVSNFNYGYILDQ